MGKQRNIVIGGLAIMALAFAIGAALPSAGVWAVEDGDENLGAGGPGGSEETDGDGEKTDGETGDEKDDGEEGKEDETGEEGEEKAEESDYDQAVAAIADYDKLQALQAAVAQVQEKVPVAVALWDMQLGAREIRGQVWTFDNLRDYAGIGGLGEGLVDDLRMMLARADGVLPEAGEEIDDDAFMAAIAPYEAKTFEQLIEMAKSDEEKYEGLQEFVQKCEEVYERGVTALRKGLAIVDPELEDLDEKTGEELLALYDDYMTKAIYPKEKLQQFIDAYQLAYGTLKLIENDPKLFPETFGEDELAERYGKLVEATKALDPEFAVDLTGVALLEPEQDGSDVPTAPDTGKEGGSEVSAVVVRVAMFGLAVIVAGIGGVVIAKRFMFSPLKRKH